MQMVDSKEEAGDLIAREWLEQELEPASKAGYICPICGSGSGAKGTGLMRDPNGSDAWHPRFKCFACGFYGDALDLIGQTYNLDATEAFKKGLKDLDISITPSAAEVFGNEEALEAKRKEREKQKQEEKEKREREKAERAEKVKEIIEKSKANPEEAYKYLEGRGISRETAQKFNIGYMTAADMAPYRVGVFNDSVIIPIGASNAKARSLRNGDKISLGALGFFNVAALKGLEPVFVVEGEVDALSILEAGFNAVSLSGVENAENFLNYLKGVSSSPCMILALDNDNPGARKTEEVRGKIKELNESGKSIIIADSAALYAGEKDANDSLRGDRAAFVSRLRDTVEIAIKSKEELKEASLKEFKAKHNAAELFEGFSNAWKNEPDNVTPTGFNELDKVLGGGLYEGLYIMGANPSQGKTTLTLQIADNVARGGRDVIIFSLEQSAEELTAKSLSRLSAEKLGTNEEGGGGLFSLLPMCGLTQREIQNGQKGAGLPKEKKETLEEVAGLYCEKIAPHLYFYEGVGYYDIFKIKEEAKEAFNKLGGNPLIIIDYLQAMKSPGDPEEPRRQLTDKQSIDTAITELKRLSRDLKTTVFLISSFNRGGYNSEGSMTSFKESGSIEYGADVLITLNFAHVGSSFYDEDIEKTRNPRKITLKIVKQRAGLVGGKLALEFYPGYNYFKVYSKETLKAWQDQRMRNDQERLNIKGAKTKGK